MLSTSVNRSTVPGMEDDRTVRFHTEFLLRSDFPKELKGLLPGKGGKHFQTLTDHLNARRENSVKAIWMQNNEDGSTSVAVFGNNLGAVLKACAFIKKRAEQIMINYNWVIAISPLEVVLEQCYDFPGWFHRGVLEDDGTWSWFQITGR